MRAVDYTCGSPTTGVTTWKVHYECTRMTNTPQCYVCVCVHIRIRIYVRHVYYTHMSVSTYDISIHIHIMCTYLYVCIHGHTYIFARVHGLYEHSILRTFNTSIVHPCSMQTCGCKRQRDEVTVVSLVSQRVGQGNPRKTPMGSKMRE